MNESQIASTLGGMKTTTLGFIAAHPVGVVVGGLVVGFGAYYGIKALMAHRDKKDAVETTEEAAPAAA